MWGTKKPEPPPVRPSFPDQLAPKPSGTSPAIISPPSGEAKTMNPVEAVHSSTTSERIAARLGASLHVKGEITGNEDLHIDGSVEGLVQLEDRKLVVGASAKVTADVIAREVVVYGNVKGNLRARDRIEIKKDGSVVGDLTTARIMIEDGAYFKGSIEIDRGADSAADHDLDKPAFSRAVTRSTTAS